MKYFDSSAFAKCYAEETLERGAEKVKEDIEKARQGEEIIISSLLLVGEVVSLFDKWHRKHLISREESADAFSV